MPPRHAPTNIAAPAAVVRTRNHVRAARVVTAYNEEEEATQCPLCCEDLDETEKKHRPCPCGYQVCLFCLERLLKEYGNRCPGCRTVYGTDREEWERQRESRAKEVQAQRPQPPPRRPSRPAAAHGARASLSRSPVPATPRDAGDRATKRDARAMREQQESHQRHAAPAGVRERPVDSDWPSLSHGPGRAAAEPAPSAAPTPAADVPARARGAPSTVVEVTESSDNLSKPSTLNLPVNVQSLVNGTNTSLETVIDLSPPSGELHTYVQRDVQPLLHQLMSLTSAGKATAAQAHSAVSRQTGTAAVTALNRRQNAATAAGNPAAPPGLERREQAAQVPQTQQHANASAAAGVFASAAAWPQQQGNGGAAPQDVLSTTVTQLPVPDSFAKQSGALSSSALPRATSGHASTSAGQLPAGSSRALLPPPGLGPPPGFGRAPPADTSPNGRNGAGPSMLPPPPGLAVDPSDALQAPNRNILHELFLQDNSGKLGWFTKPAGFEGNLHQLLDTSAPLAQLMLPTRNAARNRRPLYARTTDCAPGTTPQDEAAGAQQGSSSGEEPAGNPRDPVVNLGRKLGGRAAEIGANVQ